MRLKETSLPGVLLLEPEVHGDARGFFLESWNRRALAALGFDHDFVQDNHSRSVQGTLRGLHYQLDRVQGKLVRVVAGTVFDVAVDLRRSSPHFGRWVAETLDAKDHRQLWIPPGFAHGFLTVSESAELLYKCTDYYDPPSERTLLWNDPALAVPWPLAPGQQPILSEKDARGRLLADCPRYP